MKRFRPVPYELKVLRVLNSRMILSEKERLDYINAEKGFEGELKFDQLTKKLQGEVFIINDLLLKVGNTYFQIDTTIIFQTALKIFEVKNFEGDHFLESRKFFKFPKREIKNPFNQLDRNTSLMRQLLQQLGFQIQVESWVTFVNPEFSLFQAPLDLPVILPSQLNRFMKNMDMQPSKLNSVHKRLAEKLISLHHEKSPYTQLPVYDYEQLKKIITCPRCFSFMVLLGRNKCICPKCSYIEKIDSVVLRSVDDYKLLFPERKITTQGIYLWCGEVVSEKIIRRVLKTYFKEIGFGRWVYFE